MQPAREVGELGVGEGALEADVGELTEAQAPLNQRLGQRFEQLGHRDFVHEVEAGTAGLGGDAFHALQGELYRRRVVAADIIQAGLAEGALPPVAAVG